MILFSLSLPFSVGTLTAPRQLSLERVAVQSVTVSPEARGTRFH